MKKIATVLLISTFLVSTHALATMNNIYNIIQQQFSPQQSRVENSYLNTLDLESPYRCKIDGEHNQNISTTIPVNLNDFKLTKASPSDPLPRYEVNGYTFKNQALDEAIQTLVDEAGISVYTQDKAYPTLSAKNVYGDLESVVDALSQNGEVYYSYNEASKKLYISRQADFTISLPKNRLVILGVLDALRGAGIENIVTDWNQGILRLTLSRNEEKTVKDLIESIQTNGEMLVADTQAYHLSSFADWNKILYTYGHDNIFSATNGLQGKLLVLNSASQSNSFLKATQTANTLNLLSEGISVVPNGWRMFFDISKCAVKNSPAPHLSLSINPKMDSDSKIEALITLNTQQGEISSFSINAALNDELAIIGIPNIAIGGELLVLVKLKLIRLVGEN
ncbi:MAG: hypothetical protein IKL90_00975 [Alphaproteobacteria bacterium]|nr:hypothetical protein [Alphaproteobacteria bacterium]